MQGWEISGGRALFGGGWSDAPVAIEATRIARQPASRSLRLDASGCLVLPGIVDIHGDAFERQLMPRAGVGVPFPVAIVDNDRQLVANGITTAFYGLTLSYEPGLRSFAAAADFVAALTRARGDLAADSRIHLRYEVQTADAADTVAEWMVAGLVHLLSFNDHLDMQIAEIENPAKRDRYSQRTGLNATDYRALLDRVGGEPDDRRDGRLRRLADVAHSAGLAVMVHDPADADAVGTAAALGCDIAEFPMTVEAAVAALATKMPVVMGAPNVLRGGSHKGLASAIDLVARNLCTALASDYHYPAPLQAPFLLAERHGVPLERGWNLVSAGPAAAAGLAGRGTLEADQRGDVIVVRPPTKDGDAARVMASFVGGRLVHLADGSLLC